MKGSLTRYRPALHDVVPGTMRFESEGKKPDFIAAERCFGYRQHKLRIVNVGGTVATINLPSPVWEALIL